MPQWQGKMAVLSAGERKIISVLRPSIDWWFRNNWIKNLKKWLVLESSPHLGPKTRYLLLSDSCGFVNLGRPVWREDWYAVYNCCWPSPEQSFSGPSPARLKTIFCCLRLENSSTWELRSPYLCPPATGWPSYTPRKWVPFSSPLTTRRTTVEVFETTSTQELKLYELSN
jgi:hypothetical protein